MEKNTEIIQDIFSKAGAEFLIPADSLKEKFSKVKAFLFDWDGVFNNAFKAENNSSHFNEADSMATNLLRYSHFSQKQELPFIAVISGERNLASFHFTKRENFNSCYYKVADKIHALDHFCRMYKLEYEEICFFFDDVLDLSIARKCGVRIMINREAGLLFKNYVRSNQMADYITFSDGGAYGIREACEMLMGLAGTFDTVVNNRIDYSADYKAYIDKKKSTVTSFYTLQDTSIIAAEPTI